MDSRQLPAGAGEDFPNKEQTEELAAPLLDGDDKRQTQEETTAPEPAVGTRDWASPPGGSQPPQLPRAEILYQDPAVARFDAQYPDALEHWKRQRPFFVYWMMSSLSCLLLFIILDMGAGVFILAQISGLAGTLASFVYLFPHCHGGMDIHMQGRISHYLGRLAWVLGIFTLVLVDTVLLVLDLDCEDGGKMSAAICDATILFTILFSAVLGTHCWLSWKIQVAASMTMQMIDPISSGALQLV